MHIQTKYFGEMMIKDNEVITLPSGLPAFEEQKSYVLLPFEEGTPFFVLQSTESAEVAFLAVSPFQYVPQYQFQLPDSMIEQLDIAKEEDVAVYVLLTVQEPFHLTTANLQAPIVINTENKRGKQFFTNDSIYHTKHRIFQEVTEGGSK
ncbi:flagellar assembly protein FliW [Alkalicoccobacillus porphyridii]|uniref:Flagellar assembly factor FliW n=1 Tax=Alkalicoccobacillus porphyridii TaxID=2597270 RepID=A0A554A3T9_9BACI|nr:flagellar assembly protein FliW [Alkalicoccobacillus porphyridii]TSB48338.1 flagellar assembly protein FliW [Alkalicoccobacillus porphyridii]